MLFALSWDTLEPTEYGLVTNGITGRVDTNPKNVYDNGRYLCAPQSPLFFSSKPLSPSACDGAATVTGARRRATASG